MTISNIGPNAFTAVTLEAGKTTIGANALGTGPLTLLGGTLDLGGNATTNSVLNILGPATITGGSGGGTTGIGAPSGSAPLTINQTNVFDLRGDMSSNGGTITLAGDAAVRFNGSVGSATASFDLGSGSASLTKRTNVATLTLTVASGAVLAGSGTFGGTVTASAGSFLSPGTVPYAGATVKVTNGLTVNVVEVFTGNINQGAGTTIPIGALAGAATSRLLGGPDFAGARLVTYRIGGTGADTFFAGRILDQNAAVNNTSIVKTGAGIWTLSGSGTWNGGTTIEQGTLKITGTFTCASATNVLLGATLSLLGSSLASDAVNIAAGAQCIGHGTITGDLNNDGTVTVGTGGALTVTGDAVNHGTMRLTGGSGLVTSGSFVNNGILDLLTSSSGLPVNFENNGIVIDSTAMHVLQATKVGSSVTLTVQTYAGHNYQLQLAAGMTGPWSDVAGQAFAGNGEPAHFHGLRGEQQPAFLPRCGLAVSRASRVQPSCRKSRALAWQIFCTSEPMSASSFGSSPASMSRPSKLQSTRRKYSCRG